MQQPFIVYPDARLRPLPLIGTLLRESPENYAALPGQPFQPYFDYKTPTWPSAYSPTVFYQLPQNLQHPYSANQGLYSYNGQLEYAGAYSQSLEGQFGAVIPSQQWRPSTQQPVYLHSQQSPSQYYHYNGSSDPSGSLMHFSVPASRLANIYRPGNTIFEVAMIQQQLLEKDFNRSVSSSDIYKAPEQSSNLQEQRAGVTTIPRGPPKKPKQSGHALWVGNIPPRASIWCLKDHFSSGAMKEIESLFLISKSNCAFVNYSTGAACNFAVEKFNHSLFQGIRLVCRCRGNSSSVLTSSTGSSSIASRVSSLSLSRQSPVSDAPIIRDDEQTDQIPEEDRSINAIKEADRFFVLKSLTVQDLEQCVRRGVWATQVQNERLLTSAYESGVDVYLIFSANKSGEYFGYARMASSISEHAQPSPDVADLSERPIYTYTPATEFAPNGRITNDPVRGTIFWEAMLSDTEIKSVDEGCEGQRNDSVSQVREHTFLVDWKSTSRVPFNLTRGLRNPWNSNKDVKIARDGTELETGVGKQLVRLFHKVSHSPSSYTEMRSIHTSLLPPALPHFYS